MMLRLTSLRLICLGICYGQAMMAFLLDEAGAAPAEIKALMAEKFADLVKKHRRGKAKADLFETSRHPV